MLHQHFNTPEKGGPLRSYYLATALVKAGHEVVVVTAHKQTKYVRQYHEGFHVHYLPVRYDNSYNFYRRGFAFLKYVWKVIRLAGNIPKVDVVYAISTPITVGLAAMRIKKAHGIPYIFEVGDLWPDAPIQLGFVKNKWLQSFLYRLEKQIYQNATAIVALSDQIQKAILQKAPGKDVHVVSNFSDTQFYVPRAKQALLERKYGVEGKFVITYIGALGFANGLDFFLECARSAQKENLPIQFFICGEGAMNQRLKNIANNLHLNNVSFLPLLSRGSVKELLNVADANFVCYRTEQILETGSPNKYFDGLAAGKLTIINFNGWVREEIEREQCGVYIDKNQPGTFNACITPFLENRKLLSDYQARARAVAERLYSREILSRKFYEIFENLKKEFD